jgi:hypothetical protein
MKLWKDPWISSGVKKVILLPFWGKVAITREFWNNRIME